MRHSPISFETVSVAFAAGTFHGAAAPDLNHPEFSSMQIKKLSREARTIPQFKRLADFYESRRRMYVRMAAEQLHSWANRNGGEKSRVDSTRNLYEHYLRQAAKSAAVCARYNRLVEAGLSISRSLGNESSPWPVEVAG